MEPRPPVPNPVKRQLRQESGFGCCKCGRPFVEYHHIVPFTEDDPHFRPEDMMCLCPYCHHEATVNAMRLDEQRELKKNPINIRQGKAEGPLTINQQSLVLGIGTNQFVNDNAIFTIDNENILQIKQNSSGRIDLSIKLYDSKNNLLLNIVDNEWVSGDFLPWDIEYGFQWITIREKKGKINLTVDASSFPISLRGHLYYNGEEIDINKDGVIFKTLETSFKHLCLVGTVIKINSVTKGVSINPHPIYNKHFFVSEADVDLRIKKGLAEFEKMKRDYIISLS